MKYKVNLQLTGTIEEMTDSEQATLFDSEQVTEAQIWRLTTEGLPSFLVEQLTKKEAGKLIGIYEIKKRNEVTIVKPLMQQFVEKREESFTPMPLPWEDATVKICSFDDCSNPVKVKGLCQKHYMLEYNKSKKGKTK
jgi:hypothetical protein